MASRLIAACVGLCCLCGGCERAPVRAPSGATSGQSLGVTGTWRDVIGYALAVDGGTMFTQYMDAAGQSGIPTAFLVGRSGNIEWMGHPAALDQPLAALVSTGSVPASLLERAPPRATLRVGDPAPPLNISQWLTGQSFDHFESHRVYVIEFWATWCGPCRTSMPHLTQLQRDYGDQVAIVGVTDESPRTVNRFLARKLK